MADEVITGCGRLGEWFGVARERVVPDLVSLAKGLTSAYAPMGAVLARDHVAAPLTAGVFRHGITFGGHPMCAAIALTNMDIFAREVVLENVRSLEGRLEARLGELRGLPIVGDTRGAGFFWAVELVKDEDVGGGDVAQGDRQEAREEGAVDVERLGEDGGADGVDPLLAGQLNRRRADEGLERAVGQRGDRAGANRVPGEDAGYQRERPIGRDVGRALTHQFHLAEQLVGSARPQVLVFQLGERLVRHAAGSAGHGVDATDLFVHRRDRARIADVDRDVAAAA